jgi:hypothetical protein
MKKLIRIATIFIFPFGSFSQITELLWTNQIGAESNEVVSGIVNDADGNIYTVGHFGSTVDFDPGPAEVNLTDESNDDIFIQKSDSEGNLIWVKQLEGNFPQTGQINLDAAGNILFSGFFSDSLDANPSELEELYIYQNEVDFSAFIIKLNPDGEFIWVKQFTADGELSNFVIMQDIQFDTDDNVIASLVFSGTLNMGTFDDPEEIFAEGQDILFFKLNATDGAIEWYKQIGGNGDDYAKVVVDEDENIVLAGYYGGTADFDPGVDIYNLSTGAVLGNPHCFVAKYTSSGDFIWAKPIIGDYHGKILDLALHDEGLLVTGRLSGIADFDFSPTIFEMDSGENSDIFVLKINYDGEFNWVKAIKTGNYFCGSLIETDSLNNIYITGIFNDSADLDPSGATFIVNTTVPMGPEPLYFDAFITKWNATGEILWGGHFLSNSSIELEKSVKLCVVNPNEIYGITNFSSALDIDPNLGSSYLLTSEGASDLVLFKLNIVDALTNEEIITNEGSKLFPNPVSTLLTVTAPENVTNYSIFIYDLLGELVLQKMDITTNNNQFMTEDLANGIYTVVIRDTAGEILQSQKIVVQL